MENKTDLIERLRKIANELENECKPEFEVGKWYKSVNNITLICPTDLTSPNRTIGYGFHKGEWSTYKVFDMYGLSKMIPATKSEVLEELTKEAVKRFPIGSKIEGDFFGNLKGIQTIRNHNFSYNKHSNTCQFNGSANNGCALSILSNGIWATVIKERSLEEWLSGYYNTIRKEKYYIRFRYYY